MWGRGLVRLRPHASYLALVTLCVQLLLGLLLDGAYIVHGESVPTVRPAEHLPVEVGEQSSFRFLNKVLYPCL